MNVLLVEDDACLSAVLSDSFEERGFLTQIASTLEEASNALKANTFDVAILDLDLDGKCSLPLADMALYSCPQTAIVLLTGSHMFARGEMMVNWPNIRHCLRKPTRIGDLLMIAEFLGSRKADCSDSHVNFAGARAI